MCTYLFSVLIFVGTARSWDLTVVHTNDVHGRIEMFTSSKVECPAGASDSCFGGVSRRSSFIKSERAKGPILLLDAGDQFQGTAWFYFFKGREASHFLNELKYDAMALGNHEFDNGVNGLRFFMNNASFPILCSNVNLSNAPDFLKVVKPYTVVNYSNQSVAIIGYVMDFVYKLSKTDGLRFTNEVATVKRIAQDLTSQGHKHIIALGHAGYWKDLTMASQIPELDIIVGGHSHTLLHNKPGPDQPNFHNRIIAEYPKVVTHPGGSKTLVVQAGADGKFVGSLKVSFDNDGRVQSFSGNTVLMDNSIPNDTSIDVQVMALDSVINSLYHKEIGKALYKLDASVCKKQECALGNMFTDATVSYFRSSFPDLRIALYNGGGLKIAIDKGIVTYNDIVNAFPFSDVFVVAIVKGSLIREVMEHSVAESRDVGTGGKFLQVSGLKVSYVLSNPDGRKVLEIQVATEFESRVYTQLDEGADYHLATSRFLLDGGHGYEAFLNCSKCAVFDVDITDVDIVTKYFETSSPVDAFVEGRIQSLNGTGRTLCSQKIGLGSLVVSVIFFSELREFSWR